MNECSILFAIWGVLVIFGGICVRHGSADMFPKMYSVKNDKEYLKYLGNKIIIAGLFIILFSIILMLI